MVLPSPTNKVVSFVARTLDAVKALACMQGDPPPSLQAPAHAPGATPPTRCLLEPLAGSAACTRTTYHAPGGGAPPPPPPGLWPSPLFPRSTCVCTQSIGVGAGNMGEMCMGSWGERLESGALSPGRRGEGEEET
ncbi:hypothetical protein Vretimale_8518 [Volvox reticuliferus]|uniref:Uncharacterized protein n=1 Tax=Volvox reticuliferus TaxID=1737510 RepID=A0A8J4LNZ3_9CHLO|nr:hypothetical protein Vretimale_8518 [Volvox reticuliferus]